MKRFAPRWLSAVLGIVFSTGGLVFADVGPALLTREHVNLLVVYAPGTTNELHLVANDEDGATHYASTNVVLVVRTPSETVIPPDFEIFGDPGSPFWILPASQDPELLSLGVSAEGLPQNIFDEPLGVRLVEVRAPGWFFAWQFDSNGTLNLKMDSRDGIGPSDVIQPIVGSHGHFNWGFSSNGVYAVTFRVEGRLRGATTNLLAADTTFQFAVEPLLPEPATLSAVGVLGGQFTCDLRGTSGVTYRLQTSLDFSTWADGPEVTAGWDPVPVSVAVPVGVGALFVRAISP